MRSHINCAEMWWLQTQGNEVSTKAWQLNLVRCSSGDGWNKESYQCSTRIEKQLRLGQLTETRSTDEDNPNQKSSTTKCSPKDNDIYHLAINFPYNRAIWYFVTRPSLVKISNPSSTNHNGMLQEAWPTTLDIYFRFLLSSFPFRCRGNELDWQGVM